jgi:general L-amino acid transport system permease protein
LKKRSTPRHLSRVVPSSNLTLSNALALLILLILATLVFQVSENLHASQMKSGWGFLFERAGFDIAETIPLPQMREEGLEWQSFQADMTYLSAFVTGVFNSLKVAVVSSFVASALGVFLASLLISENSPGESAARFFVRLTRNVPLLLQLLFLYAFVIKTLPEVSQSFRVGPFYLNNRGLFFPWWEGGSSSFLSGAWSVPDLVFGGRNIRGGASFSPEFLTLTVGLGLYTSGYIAELLRAALVSLPRGQKEAGLALGLSRSMLFFKIEFPQALRIAIPPLLSQYLNLLKNTSLAVAIGYPDLVGVGSTVINQTGQALEVVLLWMSVFLFFSLVSSYLGNLFSLQNAPWQKGKSQ